MPGASLVGHVMDVQGSTITADLLATSEGNSPAVTLGDEDILIGRLGSYVRIEQGAVRVLAMVARMSEREKLPAGMNVSSSEAVIGEALAQRMVQLIPIGSLTTDGAFERGITVYPTTGAEVHAVASTDLNVMFRRFQEKQYDIGVVTTNPTTRVHLDPSSLFGRHMTILGQTGAGKSWTVASLLQKAVSIMPRAHIILLDLHGEYRQAFQNATTRVVDATQLEIPYWLMTFQELCDLLIDRTEFSAHNQIAVFKDALNELRTEEGNKLGLQRTTLDTPVFFDLLKLRGAIEQANGLVKSHTGNMIKGPLTGSFDNFLMRLDSRLGDIRYDFLLKPKTRNSSSSMEDLLRDFVGLGGQKAAITVIDLSPVPFDVRPTVTAQIGRIAFEFNYWNPQYQEFPILLVCEEAHSYITRDSDSIHEGARKSMERIAKEGRKYGVGLTVVSQRPHELSETVLSQCGTFICLRITNPDDQDYVRRLVPEAERDLVNILAGLRRGEALVLGEATPLPTRVQIDKPDPTPKSEDVDFFTHWTRGPEDLDVAAIVDHWRRQTR